jgi:uncharacterized protein (TIGR00255 family)
MFDFLFSPFQGDENDRCPVLLSMTGYGDARWQGPAYTISVEIRSVNNRFLKFNIKTSEVYQKLEPEIERTLRETLKRGTVMVSVNLHRIARPEDFQINHVALKSYYQQLSTFIQDEGLSTHIDVTALLAVPGVVEDTASLAEEDAASSWKTLEPVVVSALAKLQKMRSEEGLKMAEGLTDLAKTFTERLTHIQTRAPEVAGDYRKRLHEKLQVIMDDFKVELDASTLIKEVAIFADRTDIHEEIVRLSSHLEQFHLFLKESESSGRKLDFLIQEMNRELNTIGSKANDIMITKQVVEMKATLEKMRELIQNVE